MGNHKTKIIYVSANPINTVSIEADREFMSVKDALETRCTYDLFELSIPIFGTKLKDLGKAMAGLGKSKCLIYFSCHGNPLGNFYLEKPDGKEQEIEPIRIADYLSNYKQNLYGIIYSACYSDDLARITNQKTGAFTIGFKHQ